MLRGPSDLHGNTSVLKSALQPVQFRLFRLHAALDQPEIVLGQFEVATGQLNGTNWR